MNSLPRSFDEPPPLSDPSCVVHLLFLSDDNILAMTSFVATSLRVQRLRLVCVTEKGSLVVKLLKDLPSNIEWRGSLKIMDVLLPSAFVTMLPAIPPLIASLFSDPNPSCKHFVVKEVTEEAARRISEGSLTLDFPPAAIAKFSQHISTAAHIRTLLVARKVSVVKVGKKFRSSGATAFLLGVYELLKHDHANATFLTSNFAQHHDELRTFLETIQQPWIIFCDDTLGIAGADLNIISNTKVPHAVVFLVVTRSYETVDILVSPFLKEDQDIGAFVSLLTQLFPMRR